jgi:hypothetical protein
MDAEKGGHKERLAGDGRWSRSVLRNSAGRPPNAQLRQPLVLTLKISTCYGDCAVQPGRR